VEIEKVAIDIGPTSAEVESRRERGD